MYPEYNNNILIKNKFKNCLNEKKKGNSGYHSLSDSIIFESFPLFYAAFSFC
jgi:hypothetical protein